VLQANGSANSIIDWGIKARLDPQQRRAFEVITGSFVLSYFRTAPKEDINSREFLSHKLRLQILTDQHKRKNNDQLICFLHGPAGSGKTAVIDLVILYCKTYCTFLNTPYENDKIIVVTAMTGVAATLLQGDTTHSAVYLNQKRSITPEQVELWLPTRLLIIDEISFADKHVLRTLHKNLSKLKQQLNAKYGGINIVFSGDMRQMEPVGSNIKALYRDDVPEFKDWINCYFELGGIHRFKNDPQWGAILLRMRNGTVTLADIRNINRHILARRHKLPENIRYATYYNVDRDAINTALFQDRATQFFQKYGHTNGFIMIFSDNIQVKNNSKTYIPFQKTKFFWQQCGEDDIKLPKGAGRMDPVLKLYIGCRVMLPTNVDVKNGQANGTQATVQQILLRENQQPHYVKLDNNVPMMAVFASQVASVLLKHSNERLEPQLFQVVPKNHTFSAKIPKPKILQTSPKNSTETIEMKATQVPIVINNATTGHKLQGCGVPTLFVHNWYYSTNWPYVMSSRVGTKKGLYARTTLSEDLSKYSVPESLTNMLHQFEQLKPTQLTTENYQLILNAHATVLQQHINNQSTNA
jgi:hypothetical protein